LTTLDQRRALALRIAKTIGRDPASVVAALRSRLDTSFKFNPHQKRDSHGRWTEGGPSVPNMPSGPNFGGGGHEGEVKPRAGTFIGNVPETHKNARPQGDSKIKSIADNAKAQAAAREARGLDKESDRYDTSSPLLNGADMTHKIPMNNDGLRVWRLDDVEFDDLVRDGLQPGDEFVIADAYSTPRIDRFDPREHYVGGDYSHLTN
jgi:hypothetical protein